jgi:hypothetical protein
MLWSIIILTRAPTLSEFSRTRESTIGAWPLIKRGENPSTIGGQNFLRFTGRCLSARFKARDHDGMTGHDGFPVLV